MPAVVLAREGRTWGFFNPRQQIELDSFSTREVELSRLGFAMYYGLAVGTVAGAVILRRRRIPVLPILAPIVSVTLTVSVAFGETRYRALAEVSLVLLAAVAIDAAVAEIVRRRRPPSSEGTGGCPERDSNPHVLADSGF